MTRAHRVPWLVLGILAIALAASACDDDSLPPAGPPQGGTPPPGGGPPRDAGGDPDGSTGGDASVPGCETLDASDGVTLTAFGGSTPSFEPAHVVARWICAGEDASLQIALTTTSCGTGSGDRLVVSTLASSIEDGLVSPGATVAVGTFVEAFLSVDEDAWPTCIESGGTVTFEQVDTEAGVVEVSLDATLTDCVSGALPPITIVGAFDAMLPESRDEACPTP